MPALSPSSLPLACSPVIALLSFLFLATYAPPADAQDAPVTVAAVSRTQLSEQTDLIGSVIPRRLAQLSAQVEGLVTHLHVEEGTQVDQGQILFELDPTFAQILVDRRLAELQQSTAEQRDAQRQLREAQRLRKDGHIPQSTLESAITAAAVADAVIGQRQADVEEARERLKRHQVRAPFKGTIVNRQAELGQWLRIDSPALELSQLDQIRVEVAVPQQLISRVAAGTGAQLVFDALPGQQFQSQVSAVIPRGEDNARTFPIWLTMDNPEQRLAPGMSAVVRLLLEAGADDALVVPADALIRRADGKTLVWVIRQSEQSLTAEPVPATVGRNDGDFTELLNTTLAVGDRVVIRGNETLRPNQSVRIIKTTANGR